MTLPAIEAKALCKTFTTKTGLWKNKTKSTLAVDGVSFAVEQGELFGLLGPNGAGKTTTVRMLTTLLLPSAGTGSILGMDVVKETAEVRKHIGFAFGGSAGIGFIFGCEKKIALVSAGAKLCSEPSLASFAPNGPSGSWLSMSLTSIGGGSMAVAQDDEDLAAEWAKHGITVTGIAPGWTVTEMTETYFSQEPVRRFLLERIPLNRLGKPEDIANLAVFLASDASNYCDGSSVVVDGAWLTR